MTPNSFCILTFICFFPLFAAAENHCQNQSCIAVTSEPADPEAEFVHRLFDWTPGQVNQSMLDDLQQETARLDNDEQQIPAFIDALSREAGAALLLNRPHHSVGQLTRATDLIEVHSQRDDPQRILLQVMLSVAHTRTGQFKEAAEALSRAQQVIHLHEGSDSPTQLRLMYRKAENLEHQGEDWKAEQQYRAALRLSRKAFGDASQQTVEATQRLGYYLTTQLAYKPALTVYRDALKRVTLENGQYHPNAVPLLLSRANTFLSGPLARRAFDQIEAAIELMAEHPDRYSASQRVELLNAYGEVLMASRRESAAIRQFEAAWQLANGNGLSDWLEHLAQSELIGNTRFIDVSPDQPNTGTGTDLGLGLSYQLSASGRPKHIIVESETDSARTARYARDLLRNARFRPPIVDGKAQALEDQQIVIALLAPAHSPQLPLFLLQRQRITELNKPNVSRSRPAYNGQPIPRGGGKSAA